MKSVCLSLSLPLSIFLPLPLSLSQEVDALKSNCDLSQPAHENEVFMSGIPDTINTLLTVCYLHSIHQIYQAKYRNYVY